MNRFEPQARLPKPEELVNTLEFEEVAKQVLPAPAFATVAGSDRSPFDRITLRPRLLTPTLDMDLGVELFGQTLFTPIIAGPVADQRRYHAEGELATARGCAAARTIMIVSSRSSVPLAEIAGQAAQAKTPLWFSTFADANARRSIADAVAAGCKVAIITVGISEQGSQPRPAPIDWKAVDEARRGAPVPVVLKGVTTPQQAKTAVDAGLQGIVVSDYQKAPMEALPSIVDVCGDRVPVLVDGSFRRGSDTAMALALGARGVLVARPLMWGLAAYGDTGVQAVLDLMQSDLGRTMGALGASTIKSLDRNFVRVHRR